MYPVSYTHLHDLIIHDYGPGRQFASAHAEVPSSVDVMKSHDTIDLIEMCIRDSVNTVAVAHCGYFIHTVHASFHGLFLHSCR